MSTKVIDANDEEWGEITNLLFNINPSCDYTVTSLWNDSSDYLSFSCSRYKDIFIDKHSIDNLILALQEAKRLWGDK